MNEEVIALEDGYWYATTSFCYKWVEEPIDKLTSKRICKLHQLWQSSAGHQEWREIPIID